MNMIESIKNLIKRTVDNRGKGITIGSIIKLTIIAVVALVALSIIIAMFKWVFDIDDDHREKYERYDMRSVEHGRTVNYIKSAMGSTIRDIEESIDINGGLSMNQNKILQLGVMPEPIEQISKDAEDFETREYTASYEENNVDKTCQKFEELKPLDYIIFANANKNEGYCNYRFKVELDREQEVITLIESLDPKYFNARTFTLERSITNNTNEIKILEKKINMLDSLLKSAQAKYAALRTSGDTGALVQAINNEINLIERITSQKLSVQSQIDRLINSTGIQEERIDYSQFNITVNERKFINWSNIGEQWKYAFERFVTGISEAVQGLTIGLVMFVLILVKIVLFVGVGVITLTMTTKILWRAVRKIWRS